MSTPDVENYGRGPRFAVIVPVYNRIDEVRDLLTSLAAQSVRNFEVVIVEDGSTEPCREVVDTYADTLDVRYFYKDNEGRSIARNYGMDRSTAPYLVFFDSDCVIPEDYFEKLTSALDNRPLQCYGGPDAAHQSFSPMQKAINFAMTSFLTTGGIRGGKVSLERFVPRTFNMGFGREVYDRVGGFREMFSEDIDMSTRIREAGFSIGLIREAFVYHKRRLSLRKFFRQVHVFGMSRITLHLLYPGSLKAVHALPALALLVGLALVILGCTVSAWWFLPFGIYALALFIDAWATTRSLRVALLAVPAAVVQIVGYGTGFIRAFFNSIIMGRGRDEAREVAMRKGK